MERRFAEVVRLTRSAIALHPSDAWLALLQSARWIGVDGGTWWLTARAAGFDADPDLGLWQGPAPDGGPTANTAVEFDHGWWAMVVLPLPDDDHAAVRLLTHEAWHAFGQPLVVPQIVADERGGGARGRLETAEGRTWLRLELMALAHAISASTAADCRRSLDDAVVFHDQLIADMTEAEAVQLAALEITEGLAEYLGWLASDPAPAAVAGHVASLDPARSWTRLAAYHSGVGWSWVLDRVDPERKWRGSLDASGFAALILGSRERDHDQLTEVLSRYPVEEIAVEERLRAADRASTSADDRARFLEGGVLRVAMAGGHITFDPGGAVPVEAGTFYRPFGWGGPEGGRAVAPGGAVVLTDWSAYDLPLSRAPDPTSRVLRQPGWELALPASWVITQQGGEWRAGPSD